MSVHLWGKGRRSVAVLRSSEVSLAPKCWSTQMEQVGPTESTWLSYYTRECDKGEKIRAGGDTESCMDLRRKCGPRTGTPRVQKVLLFPCKQFLYEETQGRFCFLHRICGLEGLPRFIGSNQLPPGTPSWDDPRHTLGFSCPQQLPSLTPLLHFSILSLAVKTWFSSRAVFFKSVDRGPWWIVTWI